MSIWITGDTHGDFTRFNTSNFPRQKEMGRDEKFILQWEQMAQIQ